MGSRADVGVVMIDNDVIGGSVGGQQLEEGERKVGVVMEEDVVRGNRREKEEKARKWNPRARLRIWGRTVEGGDGDH